GQPTQGRVQGAQVNLELSRGHSQGELQTAQVEGWQRGERRQFQRRQGGQGRGQFARPGPGREVHAQGFLGQGRHLHCGQQLVQFRQGNREGRRLQTRQGLKGRGQLGRPTGCS